MRSDDMQADIGYDTTGLSALREALKALNEGAIADGLVGSRDGVVVDPTSRRRRTPPAATSSDGAREAGARDPEAGKAAARRVLAIAGRQGDDVTAGVPGTPFTEAGVARLLRHLRRRRARRAGAWVRFLKAALRYLSRPVPNGLRIIEGVGVERLQVLARQLEAIADDGWQRFQQLRALRRRRSVPSGALPMKATSGGAAGAPGKRATKPRITGKPRATGKPRTRGKSR